MNIKLDFDGFKNTVKEKSPEILLVSGLVEWATGVFFACRGTVKASEINKKHAETKKEKVVKAIDICKEYVPAAICVAAGTTSICASHGILKNRYTNVVAAYGTLTASFMEYRSRVREELGEEKEEELYYGTEKETISVKITQEDGSQKTVRKKMDIRKRNGLSPYAQKFDPKYAIETDNPYFVDAFIQRITANLNDMLMAFGHLYLNDARKQLGLECDDVGQLVGWMFDPHNLKDGARDNYIKIILKRIVVKNQDGSNGVELWIDYNVDGVIFGKMSRKEYNTGISEIGNNGLEFSNKED